MPGESVAHGGADSSGQKILAQRRKGAKKNLSECLSGISLRLFFAPLRLCARNSCLTLFPAPLRVSSEDENLSVSPSQHQTIRRRTKRVMLKTTLFRTVIAIGCLMTMSAIASADTKIKSRQTSGGQTYENTSYIKGKRQRSETNNGQMIVIQQCDLRRNIQIMPAAKAYMIQPYDETPTGTPTNPGATRHGTAATTGGVVTSTVTPKDTGERK